MIYPSSWRFQATTLLLTPLTPLAILLGLGACHAPESGGGSANWDHKGPAVAQGADGPGRFTSALYDAFDGERALTDAGFFDGHYRAPGSEGYESALGRLAVRLEESGFAEEAPDAEDSRLIYEFQERALDHPSWTPIGGKLDLILADGSAHRLHGFKNDSESERLMLPRNGRAGEHSGAPVFGIAEVEQGSILVTQARVDRRLMKMAAERGAHAILSSRLLPFNLDPSGNEREIDAILYTELAANPELPVFQISPRSHARIAASAEGDRRVRLSMAAEVDYGEPRMRTLVATIRGADRADEAVVIACHIEKPGPGGAVGVCEGVGSLARAMQAGEIAWPSRTLVFLWGDEVQQSEHWLESTKYKVVAALSADMLGQDPELTGTRLLVERGQDPGALITLPPDEHTAWGAGDVEEADLNANGLALIARTALSEVAELSGPWATAEHPWEGGSDHDVYLKNGIPALLFWQFTGFTYQTSLDRVAWLDSAELRRSSVAVLATAMAVADPLPTDLARYLASLEHEREMRVGAARDAGDDETAELWESWCDGASEWLRQLCE
ncbi:MAG: hypothetical protein ACI841_002497 [Planctomycetota bacterium]|jgi:hypothetical protein